MQKSSKDLSDLFCDERARVKSELKGAHARAVIDHALLAAPDVDVSAAAMTIATVCMPISSTAGICSWWDNRRMRWPERLRPEEVQT
jgi:hypothetical protein